MTRPRALRFAAYRWLLLAKLRCDVAGATEPLILLLVLGALFLLAAVATVLSGHPAPGRAHPNPLTRYPIPHGGTR